MANWNEATGRIAGTLGGRLVKVTVSTSLRAHPFDIIDAGRSIDEMGHGFIQGVGLLGYELGYGWLIRPVTLEIGGALIATSRGHEHNPLAGIAFVPLQLRLQL